MFSSLNKAVVLAILLLSTGIGAFAAPTRRQSNTPTALVNQNQCIDAHDGGAGTTATFAPCTGSLSQSWIPQTTSDNSSTQFVSSKSNLCLTIDPADFLVKMQLCNPTPGDPDQDWAFNPDASGTISVRSGNCMTNDDNNDDAATLCGQPPQANQIISSQDPTAFQSSASTGGNHGGNDNKSSHHEGNGGGGQGHDHDGNNLVPDGNDGFLGR